MSSSSFSFASPMLTHAEQSKMTQALAVAAIVGCSSGLVQGYRVGSAAAALQTREQVAVLRAADAKLDGKLLAQQHYRIVWRSMLSVAARWTVALPLFMATFVGSSIALQRVRQRRDVWNDTLAGALCGALVGARLRPVAPWTAVGAAFGAASFGVDSLANRFEAYKLEEQRRLQQPPRT